MLCLRSPPQPPLQPPCCAAGAQDQLPREPANSSMTGLCAKSAKKVASPRRPRLLLTWIFYAHSPDVLQLIPNAPHKTYFLGRGGSPRFYKCHGNLVALLCAFFMWYKRVLMKISFLFSFIWVGQKSQLGFKMKDWWIHIYIYVTR